MTDSQFLVIIGGGLAGCEAAWQAAQRGLQVTLFEMRPQVMTPAHRTDRLAELVCSNSLGATRTARAPGMLKAELTMLGSLILRCAEETRVPAGGALAVGREAFAQRVTEAIEGHPRITLVRKEVQSIPDGVTVVATGPLTSDAMAAEIARLTGKEGLSFFDAMAPIVAADSIAALIMSHDPALVTQLVMGYQMGLGEMRDNKIEVIGARISELRVSWAPAQLRNQLASARAACPGRGPARMPMYG